MQKGHTKQGAIDISVRKVKVQKRNAEEKCTLERQLANL
jgi:hypothetical protein